jgi:hypothetical protein
MIPHIESLEQAASLFPKSTAQINQRAENICALAISIIIGHTKRTTHVCQYDTSI